MNSIGSPSRLFRLKHGTRWLCLTVAFGGVPTALYGQTFVNVTASAGINHLQAQTPQNEPLSLTGGAAAGDFDGDGWVDLFVTRIDNTDILYRNKGDGTFQNVSIAAGFTSNLATNGPAFGDIDNDGDLDLYVTSIADSQFYLYINDGAGHFTEQAVARGADINTLSEAGPALGQSVAFGDYDRDGFLDIATAEWGQASAGTASRLLHNLGPAGPGHFQDVSVAAGVFQFPGVISHRFSPRFADMDNDGLPDLVIAADFGTSQLFWNNGDGTFTDGTVASGVGTDRNGMGSTIADFDGDGDLDWFVTAIDDPAIPVRNGNRLYVNNGDRTFTDGTDAAGVRDVGWGWGTSFLDYDNDGDLDLIATNGFSSGFGADPTTLWQNNNGVFTNVSVSEGITDTALGKGLLTLDYDNDGDLDVFITNNAGQPILYRNDSTNTNGWLRIETEGTISNRDGIGAKITIDPDASISGDEMFHEIDGGSNFLSQNQMTAHFGLGNAPGTVDQVTIVWPSGIVQKFFNVPANSTLLALEAELPGDLDGNGFVDILDLNIVLGNWNQNVIPGMRGRGDPNGDGLVDILDLNAVLANWNTGTPPTGASASIPEPATLILFGVGLGACLRRR